MQPYGVNHLRKMFLEFFERKGHLAMKSFSLVPHNDQSLLLINSGMAPLKPYFTGQEIPPRRRVTTCQKCIRTGDIENVGKTARHLSLIHIWDFCIGAACYPEGHVEQEHKEDDIRYLKQKVDSGVDFLTTQMFFDNDIHYNFLYRIREMCIRDSPYHLPPS